MPAARRPRGAASRTQDAPQRSLASILGDRDTTGSSADVKTPIQQVLVLDGFPGPKLARRLSPNGRVHWADRAMAKKEAAHAIACACLLQRIAPAEGLVRLVFRWVFPTAGRHDVDNCIATAKPMIDALVEAGVLEDDDSRHVVSVMAEVVYERGQRRLEIEISPAARAAGE